TERIAALYWEPESASFRTATAGQDNVPRAFRCPLAGDEANRLLSNPQTTLDEADRLLASMFGAGIDERSPDLHIDPRVASALAFLRESPDQYASLEALAERVHLSPSRFAHIFKDTVGVPVRRYLLWQKMRRALDLAIGGQSLTAAALSAGFADSAHLSRTVRSMLGIAPEFLFRQRERLIIHR
ncbi:MAG TPA: helix-turn-helix transcriptional regulator, partial [Usitatibacteraceae bacterium]|nr:helix-turn-helix transcriptional regulator [Usitatibacteraceae bacterium]